MKNPQFNTMPHKRGDLRKILSLLICGALCAIMMVEPASGGGKMIVGWLEKVRIFPGDLVLRAKLDTGAKTCSLNAPNLTEFDRNGEPWVRFNITNKYGQKATFERKVHRVVLIKRHGAPSQKRLVIRIGVCLAGQYTETEVSLIDRTDFIYPMLIGRSFMKGNLIVDPSAKYTTTPTCKEVSDP